MRITVRAFAAAREALGTARLELEVEAGATLREVWTELCHQHPDLGALPLQGLAVNRSYATEDQAVAEGDEVAIIPPVSGG